MAKKYTIALGGRKFEIPPMHFDLLQDAVPLLNDANCTEKKGMEALRALLLLILKGQLSEPEFDGLETNVDELFVAMRELTLATGLRPLNERINKMLADLRRSNGTDSTPASALTPDGTGPLSVVLP